jgi:predicted xylose isomerase-like sugar epimerase
MGVNRGGSALSRFKGSGPHVRAHGAKTFVLRPLNDGKDAVVPRNAALRFDVFA